MLLPEWKVQDFRLQMDNYWAGKNPIQTHPKKFRYHQLQVEQTCHWIAITTSPKSSSLLKLPAIPA
jgi:hypothetical protein